MYEPRETDEIITVVDTIPKRWPAVRTLVDMGVSVKIAAAYKRERRHFTVGLKKMAKENRN